MKSATPLKIDADLATIALSPQSSVGQFEPASVISLPRDPLTAAIAPQPAGTNSSVLAIDATASDGDGVALLAQLQAIGLQVGSSFGSVASGYLPTDDVAQLQDVADLGFARKADIAVNGSVSLLSQAREALNVTHTGSTSAYDGSGVTVDILSDSFNSPATIGKDGLPDTEATDIADGYLSADTRVLNDNPSGADEGRAMAQIVHGIAPGASILFDTAAGGQAVFARHILDLAAAGAKVIVDDVGYAAEPDYQNGIVAQAINEAAAQGVTYLSAAGNNGSAGYEGAFHKAEKFMSGRVHYTAQRFSTGGTAMENTLLPITAQAGQDARIQLEWNQPAASASPGLCATGDLDLFLTDANGHIIDSQQATSNNVGNDPIEVLNAHFDAGGTYYLRVGLRAGTVAPSDIRIVSISAGRPLLIGEVDSNVNTGTLMGHKGTAGDIPVGAVNFGSFTNKGGFWPISERFSSTEPNMIYLDDLGNVLTSPSIQQVP